MHIELALNNKWFIVVSFAARIFPAFGSCYVG